MHALKGKRTVIFNAVMAAVAMWNAWNPDSTISDEMAGQTFDGTLAAIGGVWAIGNIILRGVTNTSIWRKD